MLNAMFFYKISRWLYLHHIPFIPKLITLLIFLIYNSKVPYKAKIGKGTKLGYGGIGVVIHSDATIGANCLISQNVTIGRGKSKYPGIPIIGEQCRNPSWGNRVWRDHNWRQCRNWSECSCQQACPCKCNCCRSSG